MIPDAPHIRTTRRWALSEGVAIALIIAVVIIAMGQSQRAIAIALVVGLLVLAIIYAGETHVIRRRLAVLARPFPPAWDAILRLRIPYYAALGEVERARFRSLVAIFIDEKPIHGIGCTVDDTCRLLVAASAIIPVFAFPAWEYHALRKVLIRPEPFDSTFTAGNEGHDMALGMVGASGLFNGVMILSKPELLQGFAEGTGKHHVGIHEFAHLIDQENGVIDGNPATLPRDCLRPWTTLVHDHLTHHAGKESGLPQYAYTNEAEFFAVASEYFFTMPDELAKKDPQLYALLERIFQQHMLGRGHLLRLAR